MQTWVPGDTGQHLSSYSWQCKHRMIQRLTAAKENCHIFFKSHRKLFKLLLFWQNPELWPSQHLVLRALAWVGDFHILHLTTAYLWDIFKDRFIGVHSSMPATWVHFTVFSEHSQDPSPAPPQFRGTYRKCTSAFLTNCSKSTKIRKLIRELETHTTTNFLN